MLLYILYVSVKGNCHGSRCELRQFIFKIFNYFLTFYFIDIYIYSCYILQTFSLKKIKLINAFFINLHRNNNYDIMKYRYTDCL